MKLTPLTISLCATLFLVAITILCHPLKPDVYQVNFETSPGEIARNILRMHHYLKKAEPDKKHPIREPFDRGLIVANPPIHDDRWKSVMKCITAKNGELQIRAYTPWRREYKEESAIEK